MYPFRRCEVVLSAATPAVLAQDANPLTVLNGADVPPWKTISLGTFTSSYGLMTALDDANIAIRNLADEVMHRPAFTVAKSKSEVDLVVLSAAQLGVGGTGTSRQDILARARRLDLDLCPLEAAAQLRLQYLDQPVGEFLDVVMEPITTYGGNTVAFTLANGGAGLMIIGYIVTENVIISQERKFLFARPLCVAQPVVR